MALREPVQYALVSTAAAGATPIVAAPAAGKKIKVLSYVLVAAGAVTVKWQSAANDKTGAMSLAANGVLPVAGDGTYPILECNAAEALNLVLGGAIAVAGHIRYVVEA